MKYYHKKTNMICFDQEELKDIFEAPSRKQLTEEIQKNNFKPVDFLIDKQKVQKIMSSIKIINDKEDVEIFSALYMFLKFYSKTSKICFVLKDGINPQKDDISNLKKLKESLKENDLTDFGLMSSDGFRSFQLKAYRDKLTSDECFNFLKKKLKHYANDMGDTNFLITLQSGGEIPENFFEDIHNNLKSLNLKGGGHILISYNENNKFDVINTVYPTIGNTRIPFEKFNN